MLITKTIMQNWAVLAQLPSAEATVRHFWVEARMGKRGNAAWCCGQGRNLF
jgi:hypothetical protein